MKYILHRGYHLNKSTENKMGAFLSGLNSDKYIGIETDVRVTKDHIFILYHDPLFKGKLINNCLYQELKKENVPKLTDLLKIKTDKILLLEIKDFTLDITSLLKVLKKYPRNIYLMSFSNKVIKDLKEKNCPYKLGILNYVFNTLDNYPYDFICLLNDVITPYVLNVYRKLKIEVISYGIRKKSTMKYDDLTYIVENKNIEL